MGQQRIMRSSILPLKDNASVSNVFSDFCAGLNVLNGNVHMTFATVVADHSEEGAPARRVISARIVLPIAGAVELRQMLGQVIDALAAQGADIPEQPVSALVTPLRRPR